MGYTGKQPTAIPLSGSDIVDDSIESADIKAGTIVNSDINASAAIAQSKLVDIVNADVDASAAIATSKVSGAVTSIASHGLATSATTDTTNAANIASGTLPVARGGTGAATHTLNNVMIGAGTSALTSVAPSTSGNVLTSNGSTWASTAPAAGGITSSDQSVAKAWVNFNGETFGTRDSYNVSSVTDDGTGSYTVNIDTDMANVNYAVVGAAGDNVNTSAGAFVIANVYAVGSIVIKVLYAHVSPYDRKNVNIAIFGD